MQIVHFSTFRLVATAILLFVSLFVHAQEIRHDSSFQENRIEGLLSEARRIRFENPDSAIHLLEFGHRHFLETKDTLHAIRALGELAIVNGNQGNYIEAYNGLWKALLLADTSKNVVEKAKIYIHIGRYYSFYKRKEDALKYFRLSLAINKALVQQNQINSAVLTSNYYAFCSTYRELNEPEVGKRYLDSCYMFCSPGQPPWQLARLKFEKAFILQKEGRYQDALAIYQDITPWFEAHLPSYFVLIYTYIGDVYIGMKDLQRSEAYYQRALDISETYHSHKDFTPLIYERLADVYTQKGNYAQAYQNLKKAKELDAVFFDSRSENNRPLFAIQDAYREEKEYQKALIQKQHVAALENQERVSFLQKVILFGALILILVLGLWYVNYVRSKHKAEKLMLRQKQEMEIQKANELVELKNKELATSALKLIEKDELFSTLKAKLKNGGEIIPARELKQILKSNSVNNARNWKEFEARFIDVNETFYQNLSDKYPELSQSDQKLCALIKLNFSSKEMSKLLGISVESVHTSRYRLRKKLNLSREDNLTQFIANL